MPWSFGLLGSVSTTSVPPLSFSGLGYLSALGQAGSYEQVSSICLDSSNNVFIGGMSYINNKKGHQLAKYDSSGTLLWQKRTATEGGNEEILDIAADQSGNVYTTGKMALPNGTFGASMYTAKYDSSGTLLWQKHLGNVAGGTAQSASIAVDNSGNVYVSGYGNSVGFILIKYDTDGSLLWQKGLSSGAVYSDNSKLVFDSQQNLYAVFTLTFSPQIHIIKYDLSGAILWQRKISTLQGFNTDIQVDSLNNIYLFASIYVGASAHIFAKINSSGVLQWQKQFNVSNFSLTDGALKLITIDEDDNPYLVFRRVENDTSLDNVLTKYDPTGNEVWQKSINDYYFINNIVADKQGSLYMSARIYFPQLDSTHLGHLKIPADGVAVGSTTFKDEIFSYLDFNRQEDENTLISLETTSLTVVTLSLQETTGSATNTSSNLTSTLKII
jgi:outer membrane protein assembly factor BamB